MSMKISSDDDVLKSRFKSLTCLEDIALLLGISDRLLRFLLYKKHTYLTFEIKKRSGGIRRIQAPEAGLKSVQRRLNLVLQVVYGTRSPVHGFVKNRSVKTNASRHLGAVWILNIDLEDFFPSINFGRVRGLFEGRPYNLPRAAATTLAQICCHQGELPTGAPTSPIVANMICGKLDSELKKLARDNGCMYTRYADDITFSTRGKRLSPNIAFRHSDQRIWTVGEDLMSTLTHNGFNLNHRKTRVRNRQSSLEVTGIRINEGLNVPRALYRQVRAMLHAWERFGEDAAELKFWNFHDHKHRNVQFPPFRAVVCGKIEYIGFIRGRDNLTYIRLLERLNQLQPGLHAKAVWLGGLSPMPAINLAVWLLHNYSSTMQGTAFAVSKEFLLTAAHCVNEIMFASRPRVSSEKHLTTVRWRDDTLDLAILSIASHIPVTFEIAPSRALQDFEPVTLLGYPNHHENDGVSVRHGKIVQKRYYLGVAHYIIDADVVKGNSGGPVIDDNKRVIGVAVKGMAMPGKFDSDDQLSSFIPVNAEMIAKVLATL